MFDHLSITTTDLDRAQRFYDAVLGTLGIARVNRRERSVGYGERRGIDDGPPGIRDVYGPDYYAAFVRDPDGNRIEAVTRRPEEQE